MNNRIIEAAGRGDRPRRPGRAAPAVLAVVAALAASGCGLGSDGTSTAEGVLAPLPRVPAVAEMTEGDGSTTLRDTPTTRPTTAPSRGTTTRATTTVADPAVADASGAAATTTAPPSTVPPTTRAATTVPSTLPAELPTPIAPPSDPYAHEETEQIGGIGIPKLGLDAPLFEGIRLVTLDQGPGHWPGSAMPGEIGNVVVAGHRVSHGGVFRHLDTLAEGDELFFHTDAGTHTYRVVSTEIVGPEALWIVEPTPTPTATLFACHPPGSVSQRIVVKAELVT